MILVSETDETLGEKEKFLAHAEGSLHRAFSIFVFSSDQKLLLQKRARTKYHSKGLWSNTCCGHPRPGEATEHAARRRLQEEMGIDCPLTEIFSFIYRCELDDNLIEWEFDHVFMGTFDGEPILNTDEGEAWVWMDLESLTTNVVTNPDDYSFWLKASLAEVIRCLPQNSPSQSLTGTPLNSTPPRQT